MAIQTYEDMVAQTRPEPPSAATRPLLPHHRHELEVGSLIAPWVIEGRYFSAGRDELLELGFADYQSLPGWVDTRYNLAGEFDGYILKPDRPRLNRKGKPQKYETPVGTYPAPDIHLKARPMMLDPHHPLWAGEGGKKSHSMLSIGIPLIAHTGVYMFLKNGGILTDYDEVPWKISKTIGRDVILGYDSDSATNPDVAAARYRLAAAAHRRGAKIWVADLPAKPDGTKNGLDDLRVAGWSREDIEALIRPWDTNEGGRYFVAAALPVAANDTDDELSRLRRENAELHQRCEDAEETNRLYRRAILNTNLTRSDLALMASVVPEAVARRDNGEADAANRVQLTAGEISEDYRPEPETGQPLPAINPKTGLKPRIPRATVKRAMTTAVERGLISAAPLRITRPHANGNGYKDTVWLIDPAPTLRAMLSPWASYCPAEPVTRKPRTASKPCPECGEVHPITRRDICGGCGAFTDRIIEPTTDSTPNVTPGILSEVNNTPTPPSPLRDAGYFIGGAPSEPAWLFDAPAPEPEPADISGVQANLDLVSRQPEPTVARPALHAIETDLAAIARARGRSPVPKPAPGVPSGHVAATAAMFAPTPLDRWTDVAIGARQP